MPQPSRIARSTSGDAKGSAGLVGMALLILLASSATAGPPHAFMENEGLWDDGVVYHASGVSSSLYFRPEAVIIETKAPESFLEGVPPPVAGDAIWMRFIGANPDPHIVGRNPLSSFFNYYLGPESSGWRTAKRAYQEVVYEDLWPGIDLIFSITAGDVGYIISMEDWADLNQVQFSYEGATRIVQTASTSWRIETPFGDFINQRTYPDRLGWLRFPEETTSAKSTSATAGALLQWSTFLGSGASMGKVSLVRDSQGNLYVAGNTGSAVLPDVAGIYGPAQIGHSVIYVAKLDPQGTRLLWTTFLGGTEEDRVLDLTLDEDGGVVLTGKTASSDFPITENAFRREHSGTTDVFVARLGIVYGYLRYSTLLGPGSGECVTIDDEGRPVVAGQATSSDFPASADAYDSSYGGGGDAFVAKLAANGEALIWSSFLGQARPEKATALALDAEGNPVVAGQVQSTGFPVAGSPLAPSHNGGQDVFVSSLSADGRTLRWSTFLGGSGNESCGGLCLDASQRPILAGWTDSADFPTTPGAYDRAIAGTGGEGDVFVARLASDGSSIGWCTFLGGSRSETALGLALDASECPVLVGWTSSNDFPVLAGEDGAFHGVTDVFLARLDAGGGELLASLCLGETQDDQASGLALDDEDRPIVAGLTRSPAFPSTSEARDPCWHSPRSTFLASVVLQASGGGNSGQDDPEDPAVPAALQLDNYPNPFNPLTTIRFVLQQTAVVRLQVFDASGRLIRTLADGEVQSAGSHEMVWDGKDDNHRQVPSGVYLCKLISGSVQATHRLLLVK